MMSNQRAWVVRPKPHMINRINQFLQGGIVAIGWPDVGDLSYLSKEGIRGCLKASSYAGRGGEKSGHYLGNLNRFVNEITIGDAVIVPDGSKLFLSIVISPYIYKPQVEYGEEDFPHQRLVKYQFKGIHIERDDISDELRNRLKMQLTVFEIYNTSEVWRIIETS